VQHARAELAAELVAGLRRVDALLRETKKKRAVAVRASGTSMTEVFSVGPVIAATVTGDVRDVSQFRGRNHFAASNGTAPIEVSCGNRIVHRLSMRGNRRLNHAIHMAAVTQVRYQHSHGRTYYDKKTAEGKTGKEALRALNRQISDATCQGLKAGAARRAQAREGTRGTTLSPARPDHTPNAGSSAKPLPDLPPPYDHGPARPPHAPDKTARTT
jgi:transposase